jgi:hypothetical protein
MTRELLRLLGCAFLASILAACDPIGYGYVNQLHQAVAVVHHVGNSEKRLTLAAGERRPPQLGDTRGQRDDFFDPHGRLIATFTAEDMRGWHRHDIPPVLVITRSGVVLATEAYWRVPDDGTHQ